MTIMRTEVRTRTLMVAGKPVDDCWRPLLFSLPNPKYVYISEKSIYRINKDVIAFRFSEIKMTLVSECYFYFCCVAAMWIVGME